MILVKPLAGLGNRMRVINSCIALQKRNPHAGKIKMIWQKGSELNCNFNDLFKPINGIQIIEEHKALDYFLYYQGNRSLSFKSTIKKHLLKLILRNVEYYSTDVISPLRFQNKYWDNAKNNFVIHSYSDFYNSPDTNYYKLFQPIEGLQKLIQNEVGKFLKPTIGVHIRRTDNMRAIEKSKTELFINFITNLLEKDSNLLFYLSTDDLETESQLKKRFEGYIIHQENKNFNRNTKSGIESAVIDLFALSETTSILGSYYSSFSDTAAKIKDIPLQIIA